MKTTPIIQRLLTVAVGTALVLVAVVLQGPAASATATPRSTWSTHVEPMMVAGFDRVIAEANGFAIVTLPDGREASVPKEEALAARSGDYAPAGQDTEYGDCGYSFVELYDVGNGTNNAMMRTGWSLAGRLGVAHTWVMSWRPPAAGISTRTWQSNLSARKSWSSGLFYRTFGIGWASAWVEGEFSVVFTENGGLCTSLGPATSEWFN